MSVPRQAVIGRGDRADILVVLGPPTVAAKVPSRRKVRVQIGSSVCWNGACKGLDALGVAREVFRLLHGDVLAYLPPENDVKPRRVDVCIDHWGYYWRMLDLNDFSGRPKSRGVIEDHPTEPHDEAQPNQHSAIVSPTGATYYYGKRGAAARLLRIYNKVLEAASSGKLPWMEPIWLANKWDGKTRVWRVEIEHGGEWLSSHGFTSMLDLEGCERSLWEHYTKGVRHTCGTNTRMENRPTSDIWQAITAAALTRPPGTWKWCPREASVNKDVAGLIKQASGCVAAAIKALSVTLWYSGALTEKQMCDEVLKMVSEDLARKPTT